MKKLLFLILYCAATEGYAQQASTEPADMTIAFSDNVNTTCKTVAPLQVYVGVPADSTVKTSTGVVLYYRKNATCNFQASLSLKAYAVYLERLEKRTGLNTAVKVKKTNKEIETVPIIGGGPTVANSEWDMLCHYFTGAYPDQIK
jgi:hypothetical protein